jgi:hypothetical protein
VNLQACYLPCDGIAVLAGGVLSSLALPRLRPSRASGMHLCRSQHAWLVITKAQLLIQAWQPGCARCGLRTVTRALRRFLSGWVVGEHQAPGRKDIGRQGSCPNAGSVACTGVPARSRGLECAHKQLMRDEGRGTGTKLRCMAGCAVYVSNAFTFVAAVAAAAAAAPAASGL